jgi:hypothetical protein
MDYKNFKNIRLVKFLYIKQKIACIIHSIKLYAKSMLQYTSIRQNFRTCKKYKERIISARQENISHHTPLCLTKFSASNYTLIRTTLSKMGNGKEQLVCFTEMSLNYLRTVTGISLLSCCHFFFYRMCSQWGRVDSQLPTICTIRNKTWILSIW